jgi:hypothetical protein
MRGFQKPAVRPQPSEPQRAFRTLSRHRRTKLAHAAHTTLLKADQWSRGGGASADVATALEGGLTALQAKGHPKKA